MPQLDISTYLPQIFWAAIIFSLMLGIFIGVILPKLSGIFKKRAKIFHNNAQEVDNLSSQNLALITSYKTQRDELYQKLNLEMHATLQDLRKNHNDKIHEVDENLKLEINKITTDFDNQLKNFDHFYGNLISSLVDQVIKKIGVDNGF